MPNDQKRTGLKLDESIRIPAGYVLNNCVSVWYRIDVACLRHNFLAVVSLMEQHSKTGWRHLRDKLDVCGDAPN